VNALHQTNSDTAATHFDALLIHVTPVDQLFPLLLEGGVVLILSKILDVHLLLFSIKKIKIGCFNLMRASSNRLKPRQDHGR
jgi:hypothetical protein